MKINGKYKKSAAKNKKYTPVLQIGDATIRTKYQIRTRDRFAPNTNSAQKIIYL